jgi:hypothetical protein
MKNQISIAAVGFLSLFFVAILCGTLYAENVNLGSGNWLVTTYPPNPDPAGGITATGGNSVTVNEGAIINSPVDGVECTTNGYTIAHP